MAKKVPATKSEIMAAIAEAAGISKNDWRDDQDPCPHEGEIPPLQGREGRCPRLRQGASSNDASDAGSTEPAFVFHETRKAFS